MEQIDLVGVLAWMSEERNWGTDRRVYHRSLRHEMTKACLKEWQQEWKGNSYESGGIDGIGDRMSKWLKWLHKYIVPKTISPEPCPVVTLLKPYQTVRTRIIYHMLIDSIRNSLQGNKRLELTIEIYRTIVLLLLF